MKYIAIIIITFFSISAFAQDKEEQELVAQQKANDFVYQANTLVNNDDYVSAEMEYRKAISQQPNYAVGAYNLGNSYYKKGNFEEALYRLKQTARNATTKDEKHRAFHNIGNVLMQSKQCKEAAQAFKNALKNNPADNETRYNYALAKECAQQQQQQDDQNKDEENQEDKKDQEDKQDQEKEQENKDKKDQEDQNKEDKQDQGDQDKKEGEDKKDEEGNPKDEKQDEGKQGEEEQKQKQPQPGQLSPQQVKNLLEAMNDQEQKVQDKINAQKAKGSKVQTEKDW